MRRGLSNNDQGRRHQDAVLSSVDDFDERASLAASLLTSTSVSARSTPVGGGGGGGGGAYASTTASHFGELYEDDNDEDWEDISLPTSTLRERIYYWTFWTLPIMLYDTLRLALFVLFLAPGFANFIWYYLTTPQRQVIRYKPKQQQQDNNSASTNYYSCRNNLDLYGATTLQEPANSSSSSSSTTATTTTNTNRSNNNTNDDAATTTNTDSNQGGKPVLIFFTGGAWVIGYKAWGAFLAKVFTAMGVLVVIPDYPNYPFVTVPQMVKDAEDAIQWTLDNIGNYGGDPNRVMLAGQSAGGHLGSVVLLQKALHILTTGTPCTGFQPKQLAGFCCISAPSDVQAMSTNFQKHGLDQIFVQCLFGVRDNRSVRMDDYDPQRIVEQLERTLNDIHQDDNNNNHNSNSSSNLDDMIQLVGSSFLGSSNGDDNNDESKSSSNNNNESPQSTPLNRILPPMSIFHGTGDQTVPFEVSERFATSLNQVGITTEYIEYEGWSHTDPILEAIMDSDHRFHADLYDRLYDWTANSNNNGNDDDNDNNSHSDLARHLDQTIPECRKLCPSFMIRAGRYINPF